MKAEDYATRTLEIAGCRIRLTSYKLGEYYCCASDNVDPGAWLARTTGKTREEAENSALEQTRRLLERTTRTRSV